MVVAHGVLFGVEFGEYVVSGGSEAIAAHTAVVLGFVGGLAVGCKAYDDVAGVDVCVVDYICAPHASGDGGIDDNGAHQVAHVGGFAPGEVYADAKVAHLLQEFFGSVDDCTDDFAGYEVFVAADSGGEQDVVHCPNAE